MGERPSDADPGGAEAGPGRTPGVRTARLGRALRTVAVDMTPFRRYRDFRLLWLGSVVSEAGHQITHVAVYVQVFRLTRSAAAVGLVGLAELVPLVIASIAAGSVVDAVDRRKLLLITQVAYAGGSAFLMLTALLDAPVGFVYAGAGLSAAIGGIASPTRAATLARLVGPEHVPAAVALNQVMWNATAILGPALGGVVIATLGLPWAYGIDAVTYAATIATAVLIRPMPPQEGEAAAGLRAVREGFAYIKGRRVLQSTFAIDLVAMIFGLPRVLFPVLAVTQFGRTPGSEAPLVGILFSTMAAGALVGALASGWVGRVRHQGRAVVVAVAVWGAAVVGFGASGSSLLPALAFLALAGGADVISAVFRSSILQVSVPDRLRGRLSAIHILVVTGGPRIGDLEAGLVAQAVTPAFSVVSGGVACIVGVALLALRVPQLWRYHAGTPA